MDYTASIEKIKESIVYKWANNHSESINNPWVVYISTTNLCNNKCTVCAYPKSMREEKGNMSFDLFKRIVEQMPTSVKKVYLQKQGEPFINKDLEKFIVYLHQQRPEIHISLHTNGILAKKERVENILSNIHSMGISISAISKDVYVKVHQMPHFDRVCSNIKQISDLMLEMPKDKRPNVFIDYIFQESNSSEKEEDVINFFRTTFQVYHQ